MESRKKFLQKLGAVAVVAGLPESLSAKTMNEQPDFSNLSGAGLPEDENYWKQVAHKYFDVSRDYINLENGYYGIQPRLVLQAFKENIEKANKDAARFARKEFPGLQTEIIKRLAAFLEVLPEEIIITRNATEALNIAIQGYPFKTGDEVIINQLDYFSMIETFRMLEKNGKIKVNAFEMPLDVSAEDEIVEIYKKHITPRTKVILLTHVSNINGLIIPVAKIASMAKEKGIDVIVDSAHALGQIPFKLKDLHADFVGLNLHKWIGNPIGAGVLYVKKERIKELNPLFGDVNTAETNIGKLSHFGTTPFAVIMTIPVSLEFHEKLSVTKISARLRYLSSLWINELKKVTGIEIVTPLNQDLYCAIGAFRIKDKPSKEIADLLYSQYKILTVNRALGKQGCIRVTPAIYTLKKDIDRFVDTVKTVI